MSAEIEDSRAYLTLRETQLCSLELLKEFASLCDDLGLRYDLAGGTLLGAVRHQGFIPWDDDVDVSMPRPDYEKLFSRVETLPLRQGRELISSKNRSFLRHYGRYCRLDIKRDAMYKAQDDCPNLGIDIFPHDGVSASPEEFAKQVRRISRLRRLLLISVSSPHMSSRGKIVAAAKDVVRPVLKAYGAARIVNKLDAACMVVDFESAEYTAGITGMYGLKERWRKTEWQPQTEVLFEGHPFSTYQNYDIYLTNLYGDYLKVPPVEKRPVPSDRFYWVDIDGVGDDC